MQAPQPYFQTNQPYQPQPAPQPVFPAPVGQPQPAPAVRWEQVQPQFQPSAPFQVYPGETVAERLIKNVILKVLEVLAATLGNELARFFRGWTWPKTR